MYSYAVWIRLNPLQTANVRVQANNDWECKLVAESMYGQGNVLSYSRIND
jgi:hypothetical protein